MYEFDANSFQKAYTKQQMVLLHPIIPGKLR